MSDNVVPIGRNFDHGFVSDVARDQLPLNAAYRLRDIIPQLEAPGQKRGGWEHATSDLGVAGGSGFILTGGPAAGLSGVGWAPFPNDPHLISVDQRGRAFRSTVYDGTSGTLIGTTHGFGITHRPFWHKDKVIVLPPMTNTAASVYKYYDGGTFAYTTALLGGTPPQARMGFSWGSYLVLGNGYVGGTLYNNRLWISNVGNAEGWSPGLNFFDLPTEVVAGIAMGQFILCWGYSDTWMITGDTPPANGNWARRDLFPGVGCMDGRTVVRYQNYVYWANNTGVWKTDGATPVDLTARAGLSLFWREAVADFDYATGWVAAAGVYFGHYIISVFDNLGNLVTSLWFDLTREIGFEAQNIPAVMFAERPSGPGTAASDGSEELFFANRNLPRAERISPCWTPSSANAYDADGTPVLPQIEFPYFKYGSSGRKRMRRAFVSYDLRDAGAAPTLLSYATFSPESGAPYTQLATTLSATVEQRRKRVEIHRAGLGFGLKLVQVGASAATRFADLEGEGHPQEPSTAF